MIIFLLFGLVYGCRYASLPAKKGAQTIQGATYKIIWLNYLNEAQKYDTLIVTPFFNELGDQLPQDVKAVIPQAIREGLEDKALTPGVVFDYRINPTQKYENYLQMDNYVVFYDENLDQRILVMRVEMHRPDSDSILAKANIVARMSGFRNDPEVAKGIRKGLGTAMEEAYKGLVDKPKERVKEFKDEQEEEE